HTVTAASPLKPALDDCASLREVIRVVREAAGEAGDWRAIVDGLRPDLDRLWGALTPAEQGAFLRHLARPWECHRHRMAPAVASRVARLRTQGLLRIRAGGLREVSPAADGGLIAELASGPLAVGGIVNCAGPGLLPGAAGSLPAALIADGVARVGPHGLGLDIDRSGRLVGADARTQEGVWVLGPLRRGARWETTAVPEIRDQAHRLALDIAADVPVPALAA
ncbi:FAD-dependent oxidoreductase, partial [Actinoplanes sp. NPDC051633]